MIKQLRSKQRGLSFMGWLVAALGVVTCITLGLRVVPHYIDFQTLTTIVKAIPRDQVRSMSNAEIREAIQKRLKINNIRDLPVREFLEIERVKTATILRVNYERREALIGNMDLVMSFEESFDFT